MWPEGAIWFGAKTGGRNNFLSCMPSAFRRAPSSSVDFCRNAVTESQSLCSCLLPSSGHGGRDWSKESSARIAIYLHAFTGNHHSITSNKGCLSREAGSDDPTVAPFSLTYSVTLRAYGKLAGLSKGLNKRPDRGNQLNLWLIHTNGQSSIFHNEPTNMLHGHNLLKGLQFRRISVQFSMTATCALP